MKCKKSLDILFDAYWAVVVVSLLPDGLLVLGRRLQTVGTPEATIYFVSESFFFRDMPIPSVTLDGCNLEVPQGTLLKLYLL